MAQRNPLNQRYQGDGPGGQTRKSASSAKPVSDAAASVKVKGKPETSAEKKAAEKERKARMDKKAAERQRKAARAQQAQRTAEAKTRLARGEISRAEAEAAAQVKEEEEPKKKKKGFFNWEDDPNTTPYVSPEYRKWRRRYWFCLIGGLVGVAVSLVLQRIANAPWIVAAVVAYAFMIAGLTIHFTKIRPMNEAMKKSGGKKSPKQIKHEEEARTQAEQMEAARKAGKANRRRSRSTSDQDAEVVDEAVDKAVEVAVDDAADDTVGDAMDDAVDDAVDEAVDDAVDDEDDADRLA